MPKNPFGVHRAKIDADKIRVQIAELLERYPIGTGEYNEDGWRIFIRIVDGAISDIRNELDERLIGRV